MPDTITLNNQVRKSKMEDKSQKTNNGNDWIIWVTLILGLALTYYFVTELVASL